MSSHGAGSHGVSVIIPARNAGAFLREALDSVFIQGLADPEVIVVDDGSEDDTAAVARSYGRGVMTLSQPRSGSGRARNRGIEASSGRLLAFLDADDLWVPEKSRLQLPVLEADPRLGLVFSDMVAFSGEGEAVRTYWQGRGFDGGCSLSSIFLYDMISTPTVVMRREVLDAVGGFDETLPIGQDTDLWFRVAMKYPFALVDRPLVRRRFHGGNVTRDSRLLARCVVEIWGRYLEPCIEAEPHLKQRLLDDFARIRWNHLFEEGCSLLREGNPREARRRFGEAIGVAPFRPRPYAFWVASLLSAGGADGRRR